MLSDHEARLSSVPRWTIVRTVQRQAVSDHSFRVALIAPRLATQYFGVDPDDFDMLYAIVRHALLHDQLEAFTSDIPTPAKRAMEISDVTTFNAYSNKVHEHTSIAKEVRDIVKLADLIEAAIFLVHEYVMGNNTIAKIRHRIMRDIDTHLAKLNMTQHSPEIMQHISSHGFQQDPYNDI